MRYFFALIIALTCASMATAQQTDLEQTTSRASSYTYDFRGTTIKSALGQIALDAGIGIGYSTELVQDKITNCDIENASAKEVLLCILEGSNLKLVESEQGTFRIIKQPASTNASETPSVPLADTSATPKQEKL